MIKDTVSVLTRVAIPVVENAGLESRLSKHFGKSRGFIVVNSDGSDCVHFQTADVLRGSECAPIQAMVERGSRAVLCFRMGRGALARIHEAGLLIYQAKGGSKVFDVLKAFSCGDCPDLPDSCLCSHGHDHE